jgi:hypothetical protein
MVRAVTAVAVSCSVMYWVVAHDSAEALGYAQMLETILSFLWEVVAFYLGKFYVGVFTLGRWKPQINDRNQPLVSLLGTLITLLIAIGTIAWIKRS